MNKMFLNICKKAFLAFLFLPFIACSTESSSNTRIIDTKYSFAFPVKEYKKVFISGGGIYQQPITETNKPSFDDRSITYTSSNNDIATVDNIGAVTFQTAGTVEITARKAAENEYEEVHDTYRLHITVKPTSKTALIKEIKRAMKAHGETVNLNYIDTSLITNMKDLFAAGMPFYRRNYGLNKFRGTISKWDVSAVTDMRYMFFGASAFNGDISGWDVSKVTSMGIMFMGASAFNSDISEWDVSAVTNMQSMFANASAFNGDISGWNVSKVTNMGTMFSDAKAFNRDISKWDVSAVTNMNYMFSGASEFNKDISGWDVSAVTDIDFMFEGATKFNKNLNCWASRINATARTKWKRAVHEWKRAVREYNYNTAGNKGNMFFGSGLEDNPPSWYLDHTATSPAGCIVNPKFTESSSNTKIIDTKYSFAFPVKEYKKVFISGGGIYKQPITETNKPRFDDRSITYTSSNNDIATVDNIGAVTFQTAGTVEITARKAAENEYEEVHDTYRLHITVKPANKTALIKEIKRAMEAHGETVNLNYIDTSLITNMKDLFAAGMPFYRRNYGLNKFRGTISKWDVSAVTDMRYMFFGASEFNGDISGWNVSKVTSMGIMFMGASAFNSDISEWDVSAVTNMQSMFANASAFNGDISGWNVSKVTNMGTMFSDAKAFNRDISKWDVSAVTDMNYMFSGASEFNKDISGWDVSAVTDIDFMFEGATKFNKNLNCWASRINATARTKWKRAVHEWERAVREYNYNTAGNKGNMFFGSGLEDNPPSWYLDHTATSPAGCIVNPKFKDKNKS